MKKILPVFIIIVLIIGVGCFYTGVKYSESKRTPMKRDSMGDFLDPQSMTAEQQERMEQRVGAGSAQRGGDGFVNGEIITKDEETFTVKLRDGGSRIVFYSESTEVLKTIVGELEDIKVGQMVVIDGKVNQNNSVTATTIQIRP